jgi:hypothetical protein
VNYGEKLEGRREEIERERCLTVGLDEEGGDHGVGVLRRR